MENILKLSLIILLFSCFSCSKSEDFLDQNSKNFSSEIVNNSITNDLSVNYPNSIFLKGTFKVSKPNKGQIAIYTETDDIKHIFIISNIHKTYKQNGVINSLSYLKNGVLLNDDTFFGIPKYVNEKMLKDINLLSKGNMLVSKYDPSELIHIWISKDNEKFKDQNADELIQTFAQLPISKDCDSGGDGATSCSIDGPYGSGCSVSCGDGYHACCTKSPLGDTSCKCIRD